MRRLPNDQLQGLLRHFAQTEQFVFLDTSRADDENRYSYLFERPLTRLQCGIADDAEAFLATIDDWLTRGYYVAGWFGYEFGALLAGRVAGLTSIPGADHLVADLGVFSKPAIFDHLTGGNDFPSFDCTPDPHDEYEIQELRPSLSESEYLQAIARIKEYIRAGDTYQVNYTLKLLFRLVGSPESLYRDLRRNQSVGFGAYIRWGAERVMSFSPELFFRKMANKLIAKPMKGTLRRGRCGAEDEANRHFLHNDTKNRSENVMIVDLLRNDLGRVLHEAGGGEVQVRSLFDVETYESLLQMTSTIEGEAGSGKKVRLALHPLFAALFPCGSVTGAPKLRTMEIIAELERENRGVYTGAIGFLAPGGEAVFNVPIRTLALKDDVGEMGIGSGITHDSDPAEEWRECLLKGRFLTEPAPEFSLLETFLWLPGQGYLLLERHLARLAGSAAYFYFHFDEHQVRRRLDEAAGGWLEPMRVRLTLEKDGALALSWQPASPPASLGLPSQPPAEPADLPLVSLSSERTESDSPWYWHKTTRRQLYDRASAEAGRSGLFDVLFCNERGELTEGAISNLILYHQGRYLTPPQSSGLLAGVMREHLLATEPNLVERVLFPVDLQEAEAVFLVNSVRGVVRVRCC